jgi:hypothetical protein
MLLYIFLTRGTIIIFLIVNLLIQGYYIINDCPIAVGVGGLVECAASLIT